MATPKKGLIKKLSRSATDITSCARKRQTDSSDEDVPNQVLGREALEFSQAQISDDESESSRPGSALSSRSVPAISHIGGARKKAFKKLKRFRSRSSTRSPEVGPNPKVNNGEQQSIADEIAAVNTSTNFSLFTLLRQKFRLSSRERQRGRLTGRHCAQAERLGAEVS